jgi:hypothetical protein
MYGRSSNVVSDFIDAKSQGLTQMIWHFVPSYETVPSELESNEYYTLQKWHAMSLAVGKAMEYSSLGPKWN